MGEALLTPTIYVKPVLRAREAGNVKGIATSRAAASMRISLPCCLPEGLCAKIEAELLAAQIVQEKENME